MEYILIATVLTWQGIALYLHNKRKKAKKQLTANINARLSQIDKHLADQFYMLECFTETMDKSYLDYGDEELKKAMRLIEQNDKDLIEIRKL